MILKSHEQIILEEANEKLLYLDKDIKSNILNMMRIAAKQAFKVGGSGSGISLDLDKSTGDLIITDYNGCSTFEDYLKDIKEV